MNLGGQRKLASAAWYLAYPVTEEAKKDDVASYLERLLQFTIFLRGFLFYIMAKSNDLASMFTTSLGDALRDLKISTLILRRCSKKIKS
jgi:hypothetical protein